MIPSRMLGCLRLLDEPELEAVVFTNDVDHNQIDGDDEAIEVASIE